MSGAMIRISKSDDPNTSPSTERQIMITGNTDSVALAKSLINIAMDLGNDQGDTRGGRRDRDDRRGGMGGGGGVGRFSRTRSRSRERGVGNYEDRRGRRDKFAPY